MSSIAPPSFDLARFVAAQASVYADVLDELSRGRKTSHWMWFVFPQLRGLGRSPTAQFYGISGRAEAAAYLAHSLLGPRLDRCARLLLAVEGREIAAILPPPDDLKLRSSMTLFAAVATDPAPFVQVLDRYFGGERDAVTLDLLQGD